MSQKLFAAASEPKQLLLIPKAGHDNNMDKQYYQLVRQFIEKVQRRSTI